MCIQFSSEERSGLVQQECHQGVEKLGDGKRLREAPSASLHFPVKQAKVMFEVGRTEQMPSR